MKSQLALTRPLRVTASCVEKCIREDACLSTVDPDSGPSGAPLEPLGGFGLRQRVSPDMMYSIPQSVGSRRSKGKTKSQSSTGSVTTKKELGIIVTDFFDYSTFDSTAGAIPQLVNNYYWNCAQNLFNDGSTTPAGSDSTFCRVRKVCVWVLPLCRTFTGANATTNARAAITVNCQTPGIAGNRQGGSFSDEAFATDTQVTNVLPMIDTKWKKVFTCDLQRTFQSGVIRPVFVPGTSGLEAQQCIFQMSVVNQIDGKPYLVGDDQLPIRVKVQLTVDQPIATFQTADLTVFRNEEFSLPFTEQNGVPYAGTVESYVQMDLRSVNDHLR